MITSFIFLLYIFQRYQEVTSCIDTEEGDAASDFFHHIIVAKALVTTSRLTQIRGICALRKKIQVAFSIT